MNYIAEKKSVLEHVSERPQATHAVVAGALHLTDSGTHTLPSMPRVRAEVRPVIRSHELLSAAGKQPCGTAGTMGTPAVGCACVGNFLGPVLPKLALHPTGPGP